MLFNDESMSDTSMVMTVFLTGSCRLVIPPLIAPGSVGIRVFWSTGVVPTPVIFHSRILLDLPSERFLVEGLGAFHVVGRYLEMHHFTRHFQTRLGPKKVRLISHRYTSLPLST